MTTVAPLPRWRIMPLQQVYCAFTPCMQHATHRVVNGADATWEAGVWCRRHALQIAALLNEAEAEVAR